MVKRTVCDGCGRPARACLCSHLICRPTPFDITIWQDPDEAKHPLSTAPLLQRSLLGSRLIVGDSFNFQQVFADIPMQQCALLFPLSTGAPLAWSEAKIHTKHLLVLDGTWRKVRRLLHLNPWLLSLPYLTLAPQQPSRYDRKSSVIDGVSTLEAVLLACDELIAEGNFAEGIRVLDRMAEIQAEQQKQAQQ